MSIQNSSSYIRIFLKFFAFISIALAIIIALYWPSLIITGKYGDEIALNAATLRPWTEWFTSGYSNYFNVYPEFSVASTNYIRPTMNFAYWIFNAYQIPYSIQLIISCYIPHAVLVALVAIHAKKTSLFDSILAGSAMFFAAAFWPTGSSAVAFGIEYWMALFVALSIQSAFTGWRLLSVLLLLIAVFSKETSLPVVVAYITFALMMREYRFAALCAAVLAIYWIIRYLAFGSLLGGVNASERITFFALIRFLTFPSTYTSLSEVKQNIISRQLTLAPVFIVINAMVAAYCSWLIYKNRLFLLKLFKNWASGHFRPQTLAPYRNEIFVAGCFSASLIYFLAIGVYDRFSYLALFLFIFGVSMVTANASRRIILLLTLVGNLIGFLNVYFNTYRDFQNIAEIFSISILKLEDKIQTISSDKPIYLANDFITVFSKPSDLALLTGSHLDLYKGSSLAIQACNRDELRMIQINHLQLNSNEKQFSISLPACAEFVFEGAEPRKMIHFYKDGWIERNRHIAYQPTSDDKEYDVVESLTKKELLPKQMTIRLRDASLLYFDFSSNDWVFIE